MAVACKQEQLLGGMPAFDCRVWHGINRYFDVAKHWWGLKVTELGYSGKPARSDLPVSCDLLRCLLHYLLGKLP